MALCTRATAMLFAVVVPIVDAATDQPFVAATDGDTIRVDGVKYRLWGIDAPEMQQACADGWAAGHEAAAKLRELMAGRVIICEPRATDRYGRIVALCSADGRDLGADMVSVGMAWAFIRYSSDYVQQERTAARGRAGVHAHECERPWDWRARRRAQ